MRLREQAAWQDGLVPYRARLLAEYKHSSSELLVVSGGCARREGEGTCWSAKGQASPTAG